jgi:hypothetical protein
MYAELKLLQLSILVVEFIIQHLLCRLRYNHDNCTELALWVSLMMTQEGITIISMQNDFICILLCSPCNQLLIRELCAEMTMPR